MICSQVGEIKTDFFWLVNTVFFGDETHPKKWSCAIQRCFQNNGFPGT